ncbi:MAG: hypothetical protein FD165_2756 [Gammaproteobacteria bacterium]|nr:MAG: hypothetical protein FD165_2756 [Gammaproteobacteria bacterium]TND00877.1 MAG: hypothetical protein FD120_2718 [Gammaproteobacteria bacterium]
MGIETEIESEVIGALYGASGKGLIITKGVTTAKGAAVGTAAGAATLAKGTTVAAFWKTTAFKVGMGVGLASWTPIIIGGLVFAGGYTFVSAMRQVNAHLDTMELKL